MPNIVWLEDEITVKNENNGNVKLIKQPAALADV